MKVVPIAIPTPFYVGTVNIYLIREDPITLIDVGPKTPEAYIALTEGLAKEGIDIRDIRRILLTHAHEDHCGLSKTILDEAINAEILVHSWETGHLFGRLEKKAQENILLRTGVPIEVFRDMQNDYADVSLLTDSLSDTEFSTLRDEEEILFERGSLLVMHTPGHTPGSCSFYRAADRTLFCGDCALKRISPNPMVSPDPNEPSKRFSSLSQYLKSLEKIRKINPTVVRPGHGDSISDFELLYKRYRQDIDQRQMEIIRAVSKSGSTAWEIAQVIFPNALDQKIHRFLAVSETIAHLDYAVNTKVLNMKSSESIDFFLT